MLVGVEGIFVRLDVSTENLPEEIDEKVLSPVGRNDGIVEHGIFLLREVNAPVDVASPRSIVRHVGSRWKFSGKGFRSSVSGAVRRSPCLRSCRSAVGRLGRSYGRLAGRLLLVSVLFGVAFASRRDVRLLVRFDGFSLAFPGVHRASCRHLCGSRESAEEQGEKEQTGRFHCIAVRCRRYGAPHQRGG